MSKVTADDVRELVDAVGFTRFDGTTITVCCMKLKNGYAVVGKSACMDAADFDEDLGRQYAFDDAVAQAIELEGYRRKVPQFPEVQAVQDEEGARDVAG